MNPQGVPLKEFTQNESKKLEIFFDNESSESTSVVSFAMIQKLLQDSL